MRGDKHWGIWVHMELEGNTLLPVGFELLGKGREMADKLSEPLTALIFGHDVGHLSREAIRYGADEVLIADHPLLEPYTVDGHGPVLARLIMEKEPNILLFGSTFNGRDLAGRLAVKMATGLTANAVRLEVDASGHLLLPSPQTYSTDTGHHLDVERQKRLLLGAVPGFGGTILAVIKCEKGRPQMCTVRPGIFKPLQPDDRRRGRVEEVPVALKPEDIRIRVQERKVVPTEDIGTAERVVVAGLGTGGDLRLVEQLAARLGASIGVTRPLVDMGVAPREKQVGSTGVALRSKLAVVVGASGDSHFISGLRDVGTVIAVNKDENAPIFQEADVCLVGDLFEVLPQLLEVLEREVVA